MHTGGQQSHLFSVTHLILALLCASQSSVFIFIYSLLLVIKPTVSGSWGGGTWSLLFSMRKWRRKIECAKQRPTLTFHRPPSLSPHLFFHLCNFLPSAVIFCFQILCFAGILKGLLVETGSFFINIPFCMPLDWSSTYQYVFAALSDIIFLRSLVS